jgi:hypothetical protein
VRGLADVSLGVRRHAERLLLRRERLFQLVDGAVLRRKCLLPVGARLRTPRGQGQMLLSDLDQLQVLSNTIELNS